MSTAPTDGLGRREKLSKLVSQVSLRHCRELPKGPRPSCDIGGFLLRRGRGDTLVQPCNCATGATRPEAPVLRLPRINPGAQPLPLTGEAASRLLQRTDPAAPWLYGLTVRGDLDLSGTSVRALPSGLTVEGRLLLSETPMRTLPPSLRVDGSLIAVGSALTHLPQDLQLGGGLYLSDSAIERLPTGLHVPGNLVLIGARHLHSLPADLRVDGDLDVSASGITHLPEDADVRGQIRGLPTPR